MSNSGGGKVCPKCKKVNKGAAKRCTKCGAKLCKKKRQDLQYPHR